MNVLSRQEEEEEHVAADACAVRSSGNDDGVEWVSRVITHMNPLNLSSQTYTFTEMIDASRLESLMSGKFSKALTPHEQKQLREVKRQMKVVPHQGYCLDVTYAFPQKVSSYNDVLQIGRLSAKNQLGMQGFSRNIRNYLASENYVDVDIVNCQVVLAQEAFLKMGLSSNSLAILIAHRDDILDLIKSHDELHEFRSAAKIRHGDRQEVKEFILKLLFDYNVRTRNEALKMLKMIDATKIVSNQFNLVFDNLAKELEENTIELCSHPELERLSRHLEKVRSKNYSNELGSVFSYFLQHLELSCSLAARSVLEREFRTNVGTHIHDGFFVRKKAKDWNLPQSELNRCSEFIRDSFLNVNVELCVKPMSSSFFDKDGKFENDDATADDSLFREQVKEFESSWFFINDPGRFYRFSNKFRTFFTRDNFEEITEPFLELNSYEMCDVQRMIETSRHGVIKGARFDFQRWKRCLVKENEADGILMNPGLPPGLVKRGDVSQFNVFPGFEHPGTDRPYDEAVDGPIIKPMLDLWEDVVGGGIYDEDDPDRVAEIVKERLVYAITNQAWIIHHPTIRMGVIMILYGGFGDGKDTAVDDSIGAVIGRNKGYLISNRPGNDFINTRFNSIISGKILVKGEELSFSDSKEGGEALKSLTTADTVTLEAKNQPIRVEDSFHNFIFTTNNPVPINLSTGDRRTVIFETKRISRTQQEWAARHTHFKQTVFKDAWARYLRSYPIPAGWNAERARPRTEAYARVIRSCAPQMARAFDSICTMSDDEFKSRCDVLKPVSGSARTFDIKPKDLLNLVNDTISMLNRGEGRGFRYGIVTFNAELRGNFGVREVKTGHKKDSCVDIPHISFFKKDSTFMYRLNIERLIEFLESKGWHESVQ